MTAVITTLPMERSRDQDHPVQVSLVGEEEGAVEERDLTPLVDGAGA